MFRLPGRTGGAAGCHGEPAHYSRRTGPVDPPFPGEDPTHSKYQKNSSLIHQCAVWLRAAYVRVLQVQFITRK